MKLKNVDRYTFDICMNFLRNQTPKNILRLTLTLKRWSKKRPSYKGTKPLDDYGYTADNLETFMIHLHYCSDRMNQGRAKALLRLLKRYYGEENEN